MALDVGDHMAEAGRSHCYGYTTMVLSLRIHPFPSAKSIFIHTRLIESSAAFPELMEALGVDPGTPESATNEAAVDTCHRRLGGTSLSPRWWLLIAIPL